MLHLIWLISPYPLRDRFSSALARPLWLRLDVLGIFRVWGDFTMKVQTHSLPSKFEDLPPGTFFKWKKRKEFGISCNNFEGTKLAMFFSPDNVNVLGAQIGDAISFPNAVIRPDYMSTGDHIVSAPYGALISTVNGFYIRAETISPGGYLTFNVSTGAAETVEDTETPMIVYRKWKVGHGEADKFETIFEFPVAAD